MAKTAIPSTRITITIVFKSPRVLGVERAARNAPLDNALLARLHLPTSVQQVTKRDPE